MMLGRRDDAPDGLPADLRRRRGDRGVGGFASKHGLRTDVLIAGQSLTTDLPSTYDAARHDPRRRLRHDARRPRSTPTSRPASARRTST